MKRTLSIITTSLLTTLFALALFTGCGTTKLEPGGAYAPVDTNGVASVAPDYEFYLVDSAFDLAVSALDTTFKFERENRALLWKVSPSIKHGLDAVRPAAVKAKQDYARARMVYKLHPVPANLNTLQEILTKAQQLAATAESLISQPQTGTSVPSGLSPPTAQ